ncbi:hypothetical protein [Clostridium sp.]|uniref:hypothetical protein n=1 Tax=Clostridium sp. TaxID=1506 RepID=UPI003F3F64E3
MIDRNNNFNNKEDKLSMGRKIGIVILTMISLAVLFCGSYILTGYFTNPTKQRVEELDGENKTVYSETSKYLKDNTIIILKTGKEVDSEEELVSIKSRLGLTGEISKEALTTRLENDGYKLVEDGEAKLVFGREGNESGKVEPNKFFIGEKDGYLAIYFSDENGNLSVTSEKDVFRERKMVKDLPELEQNKIKNFEFIYDSRQGAMEDITELIS